MCRRRAHLNMQLIYVYPITEAGTSFGITEQIDASKILKLIVDGKYQEFYIEPVCKNTLCKA